MWLRRLNAKAPQNERKRKETRRSRRIRHRLNQRLLSRAPPSESMRKLSDERKRFAANTPHSSECVCSQDGERPIERSPKCHLRGCDAKLEPRPQESLR